jgi:hypothetical protein
LFHSEKDDLLGLMIIGEEHEDNMFLDPVVENEKYFKIPFSNEFLKLLNRSSFGMAFITPSYLGVQ